MSKNVRKGEGDKYRALVWLAGYLTPSLNQLLRMHWAKRVKEQHKLIEIFTNAFWAQGNKYDPNLYLRDKKCVEITSFRKSLLDHDNFSGGLKPLLDVIKSCGLIYDDSPNWIELQTRQKLVKKNSEKGTLIEIYSIFS